MTTSNTSRDMAGRELLLFRSLFVFAALWNFAGALPGLLDTGGMFAREFGRDLTDPVMIAVYRGAWGTAFLYGFGFLIVAWKPVRHSGVVLMGGLGKALFAINLAWMYLMGWTSDFAILVIGGDIIFVALFGVYFVRLRRLGHSLI
ncbi:hypothetical protein GCM10007420_19390 [Glycocaulis albus]|jgi:hypothetical protein|uniref:Uncharacterized protein n=1 Tax=Glycocaulis albus TaxID=1382801 RepID=A0ABQ1XTU0_9PROT|nr:hypothetical protein [Glycocaulis albus]GGH03196.1 hypothetical protein GCM10007420_19390 [Glycocaulis albus]